MKTDLRCIYAFEFPDNHVYIGLTYDLNERKRRHYCSKKSSVFNYINLTGLQPRLKQLTDYMTEELSSLKEYEYIEEYKKSNWYILNRSKPGTLGGGILKWTKEKCQNEALNFSTRKEFHIKSCSAYDSAYRNSWLDNICSHMIEVIKPKNYWMSKENCLIESLKYSTKTDFRKNSPGAYSSSIKNLWLDDICLHMIKNNKSSIYWTKEKCYEESLKYESRTDFYKNCKSGYGISAKNKWLDEICKHMLVNKKPNGYYTKEICRELSLKYNNKLDFLKNDSVAYRKSRVNCWLDEFLIDMKNKDNL